MRIEHDTECNKINFNLLKFNSYKSANIHTHSANKTGNIHEGEKQENNNPTCVMTFLVNFLDDDSLLASSLLSDSKN